VVCESDYLLLHLVAKKPDFLDRRRTAGFQDMNHMDRSFQRMRLAPDPILDEVAEAAHGVVVFYEQAAIGIHYETEIGLATVLQQKLTRSCGGYTEQVGMLFDCLLYLALVRIIGHVALL